MNAMHDLICFATCRAACIHISGDGGCPSYRCKSLHKHVDFGCCILNPVVRHNSHAFNLLKVSRDASAGVPSTKGVLA
jgi:hypothetical protein